MAVMRRNVSATLFWRPVRVKWKLRALSSVLVCMILAIQGTVEPTFKRHRALQHLILLL